jgi:hypothetical protein
MAGKPVIGFAEFLVLGVRQEAIGEPRTKLSIVLEDKDGHKNTSPETHRR